MNSQSTETGKETTEKAAFLASLRRSVLALLSHALGMSLTALLILGISALSSSTREFFAFERSVAKLFDTLGNGTLAITFVLMAVLIIAETAAIVLFVLRHYRKKRDVR